MYGGMSPEFLSTASWRAFDAVQTELQPAYLGGVADAGVLSYKGIVPCAPLRLAHAVRLMKAAAPIAGSVCGNQLLSEQLALLSLTLFMNCLI